MTLFRHERAPHCIDPGDWPERSPRPRVLIENPDAAEVWAHAEILREAGYDVATCTGPVAGRESVSMFQRGSLPIEDALPARAPDRTVCPLVAGERCPLVEGADVVITTTALTDARGILAAHSYEGRAALVVEGTSGALTRHSDVIGDATVIQQPVTQEQLLAAVKGALGSTSEPRP